MKKTSLPHVFWYYSTWTKMQREAPREHAGAQPLLATPPRVQPITTQAQRDSAGVVIATTSCVYISPSVRVSSREGKQAGLRSQPRKAASPTETPVEPNPVVSPGSPSPELAARGQHSALAWPHLPTPRTSCYMHCIRPRS